MLNAKRLYKNTINNRKVKIRTRIEWRAKCGLDFLILPSELEITSEIKKELESLGYIVSKNEKDCTVISWKV